MPLSKNRGPLLTSDIYGEIDLLPKEFLAKIGIHREEQEVPLDITPDLLVSPLVLSQVIQSRTNERKKTNISLIGDLDTSLNDEVFIAETCQIGHRTRQLVLEGTDLPDPNCLWQSAEQHNLGNGFLDQSIILVDEFFEKPDYKRERPVVTPEDFRAKLQEFDQSMLVCGTGTPPSPFEDGDGLISQEVNQLDGCKFRASQRMIDQLDLPVVNLNHRTNKFKQSEAVARWLREDTDTPTQPTALRDTSFTKLGDGTALEERISTEDLFDQHVYAREKSDIAPGWAKALLPILEEAFFEEGTAVDPDPLPLGVLSERQQQEDVFDRRITRRTRDLIGLPTQRVGYRTNKNKQVETLTDILEDDSTVPLLPTALRDVTFEVLGDGSAVEQRVEIDETFTQQVYETSRPEVWPERFRALVPLETDRHLVEDIAAPPVLLPEDVRRSEQQEDEFTMRTEVATRNLPGLPTDQLHGQEYEDTYDVLLPYDEWIDTAGVNLGLPRAVVTPQGDGTDHVKQINFSSVADALDAYSLVFPGTTSLNNKLPDILSDLASVFEVNSGNGSYSETGAGYWNIRGSYSLSIRGSGNGSAAVVADADFLLTPPFFPVKPTTRVVFFLPKPVTPSDVLTKLTAVMGASVSAWPNFNPAPVTVVCTSRKVSVRAEANQHTQSGGSSITPEDGDPCTDADCVTCDAASTTGTGTSTEVGITIKTIRVPPSLHGVLNLHNTHDETATAQAYAFDGGTVGVCIPPEYGPADTGLITMTATGAVDCDAAATPVTTYPSSGLHLLDSSAQPYKYGYVMIHTEVFDFADL